jgi:ABC-type microcin C transport system duplicated ATPase subunit YejF
MNDKLLEIENLSVHFHIPEGVARAVNGISFHLAAGETVGLVGESGCGKSVTSLSILGLIPSPPGRIESGKIMFSRQNLLDLDLESLRKIRGRQISMIFQEPMTSLNPVLPIGRQVAEPLMIHQGLSKAEAFEKASAPAFRRDASAGNDCHGHGLQSEIIDCRRTYHRAGCHDSGPDPVSDEPA